MKSAMLSNLAEFKLFGLPIGAVAGGAVVGGVGDAVTGLITGAVPQAPTWAIKAGLAFATVKWGPKIVGNAVAQTGGLFLTYDALQELFNLRSSISNVIGGLMGKVVHNSPPVLTGVGSAGPVAPSKSYYSAALGGR